MKARIYLSILVSGLLGWYGMTVPTAQAQFIPTWNLDEHAYEYDMSAFIALRQGQTPVNRWNELQVAAFCKTECRGIATVQQIDTTGVFYYYLRIRSNSLKGDTIHFKCFDKVIGMEYVMPVLLVFEHLTQLGHPSSPYKLYFPQPVTGVSLNLDSLTLDLGEQGSLIATVLPADATNKQVNWTISDTTVAKVSVSGLVTALKYGVCQLKVTTADGGFSDSCRITVVKIVGLPNLEASEIQLIYQDQHLRLKGLQTLDLIQILSLDGNILKSVVSEKATTNLFLWDLPKGFYLVRIYRGNRMRCFKILR